MNKAESPGNLFGDFTYPVHPDYVAAADDTLVLVVDITILVFKGSNIASVDTGEKRSNFQGEWWTNKRTYPKLPASAVVDVITRKGAHLRSLITSNDGTQAAWYSARGSIQAIHDIDLVSWEFSSKNDTVIVRGDRVLNVNENDVVDISFMDLPIHQITNDSVTSAVEAEGKVRSYGAETNNQQYMELADSIQDWVEDAESVIAGRGVKCG